MEKLFHITTQKDWEIAVEVGIYKADSLSTEGFIHCSTDKQVAKVANLFYKDIPNLMLLAINPEKVNAEIKWEIADGDTFPHIYGAISIDAIESVETFSPDENGNFVFP